MACQDKWAIHAQTAMDACGIAPELLLARALLLGLVMEPFDDHRRPEVKWVARGIEGFGMLGETPEQLAYRWLEYQWPNLVRPIEV